MMPDAQTLLAAMEATWPPAAIHAIGPWQIRDGQGGGKRVSAATSAGLWSQGDLPHAEAAMRALDQPPLFLIRPGDEGLDAALAASGYALCDPVVLYASPVSALGPAPDPMTAFPHWPPLAIAEALWAEGGIGPARLAVMHRAPAPKAAFLGRSRDRACGAAFVSLHGPIAMLHALEVAPAQRRAGTARNILRRAAQWAEDQGATALGLAVTEANLPARALYASLGMQIVGRYHYRAK
jgi:GNAT superfamily N-acetyltransferase